MTTFELADNLPQVEFPPRCCCPGQGPWNVLVSISGTIETASVSFTHVDCGQSMELPEWMDINADDVPMRLSVASTTDRGPDDVSWFELAPVAEPENVEKLADVVDRVRSIGGLGS